MLLREIAVLDEILSAHAAEIGGDFTAYRNHAYRVANLCAAQAPRDPETVEKIGIAAAFHDLGIWTDKTFDYLTPSVRLAGEHLARKGRAEWTPEIAETILQHHKISRWRGDPAWIVEPFRRADWADVTLGLVRFGQPRALIREAQAAWPDAGFHLLLLRLELRHLGRHPLNPLPVLKW